MELLYYTAMQNTPGLKAQAFLLFSVVVFLSVVFNITNDILKTKASADNSNKAAVTIKDTLKDFKSLDNYITYAAPANWVKVDQVDKESGNKTLISLASPDFNASDSGNINSGIRIIINRSYDPQPEETIKNKLNTQYQFYNYNIRAMTINDKRAMTMHEDYAGHNRFVFIANGDRLWQFVISAKDLEEEQKYENEINSFLNSIQFKN